MISNHKGRALLLILLWFLSPAFIYIFAQVSNEHIHYYKSQIEKYVYADLDSAEIFLDSLIRISSTGDDSDLELDVQLFKGIILRQEAQYGTADSVFDQVLSYLDSVSQPLLYLKAIYQKGANLHFLEKREESLEYLFEGARLAKQQGKDEILARVYNVIGLNYKQIGNSELAIDYYQRSLTTSHAIRDTTSEMIAYNSIGVLHMKLGNVAEGRKSFTSALDLALQKDNKLVAAGQYRNLGVIEQIDEEYSNAERYFRQALRIRESIGLPLQILGSYYDLGENFRLQGKYGEASGALLEAQKIAQETGALSSESYVLNSLGNLYEEQGRFKEALDIFRKQEAIQDTIHSLEINKEILQLEAEYDAAQKQIQIAEGEIMVKNRTYQRNLLFVAVGVSLVALLFFWNRHHLMQRLAFQNDTVQRQRIAELEQEKKITNMSSMIEGQEAERRRIAKDLHDGLGGLLTAVKTQMAQIHREIKKLETIDIYNRANDMIDEAYTEVRRISHDMMPGILRIEGLKGAVEDLISRLQTVHHLAVDHDLSFDQSKLSDARAHMIYRIIQECCNNVIKHSAASEIILQIVDYEDHLHVLVEDNGLGFNVGERKAGLGLESVKSRVDFLNGHLDLLSSEKGTSISITIPSDDD